MSIINIIDSMSGKWEVNLPSSLKRLEPKQSENSIVAIASEILPSVTEDSWLGYGLSLLETGVSKVAEVLVQTDEAISGKMEEKETLPESEILKNKLADLLEELKTLQKGPESEYDCGEISKLLLSNLEAYKQALESEFNVIDELADLDQFIAQFRILGKKIEEQAKLKQAEEEHENSLCSFLSQCMDQISKGATEAFSGA